MPNAMSSTPPAFDRIAALVVEAIKRTPHERLPHTLRDLSPSDLMTDLRPFFIAAELEVFPFRLVVPEAERTPPV